MAQSSSAAAETSIRRIDARPTACMRVTTTKGEIGKTIGELLSRLGEFVERNGGGAAGPPYARYFRWSDDGVDVEIGIPVARPISGEGQVVAGELPGGEVARTLHLGPYDGLTDTYDALHEWITGQGREPAGAPWEVYVRSYSDVTNPSQLTTEVVWPVR